jgi:hypothetical protein
MKSPTAGGHDPFRHIVKGKLHRILAAELRSGSSTGISGAGTKVEDL